MAGNSPGSYEAVNVDTGWSSVAEEERIHGWNVSAGVDVF